MKSFLVFIMIAGLAFGCDGFSLTTPDSADRRELETAVQQLPDVSIQQLSRFAMSRYGLEWLDDQTSRDVIGRIYCKRMSADGDETDDEVEVEELQLTPRKLAEMIRAYNSTDRMPLLIFEAIEEALEAARRHAEEDERYHDQYGALGRCRSKVSTEYSAAGAVPKKAYDPSAWRTHTLTDVLISLSVLEISRMPSLMHALGLTVAGGGALVAIDGIGLLLCPLSDAIACPDDPEAPGVPQPGPGDGDHR